MRGVLGGWTGLKVYEHPGYLKIGTSSTAGYLTTPPLSVLTGTCDIAVSFEAMAWETNTSVVTPLTFTITGGGAPSISGFDLPTRRAKKAGTWSKIEFTVEGATPETQITINSGKTSGAIRFIIDNIKVMSK